MLLSDLSSISSCYVLRVICLLLFLMATIVIFVRVFVSNLMKILSYIFSAFGFIYVSVEIKYTTTFLDQNFYFYF